jgi:phosphoribosyl 1,2-cyclic phosphodiesterase
MGEKLLYMTDLGVAPMGDFENYDVYIVEANYTLNLLDRNYDDEKIRKVQYTRVHSDTGHLSIEDCLDFLSENVGVDTKKVILSHLSGQNGNKELFLEKAYNALPLTEFEVAECGLGLYIGDVMPF